MPDKPDEAWETNAYVRRSIVIPADLAERLAAEAARCGVSVSELIVTYAEQGLNRAD